jgi:hypothetical protein
MVPDPFFNQPRDKLTEVFSTCFEGSTSMDFRPLNDTERRQLIGALRGNAEGNTAILMDRQTTMFAGTTDDVTDDEVISAIKSVPCHY